MKYKALLFDLDGTLLNTIDDLRDSTNYILNLYGYPPRTLEEMKMFVGKGIPYMLSCAVPNGTQNKDYDSILKDFTTYYAEHCQIKTGPYDGINELLETLKEAGYLMAVVTNKQQKPAEELIHKMFPSISLIIGDSPLVKKKPEPDGCLLAMEKLGVTKEETAYIGDSNIDYLTAKNTGLPCLSVLWGFRTKEQLLACGADTFFQTPKELCNFLL